MRIYYLILIGGLLSPGLWADARTALETRLKQEKKLLLAASYKAKEGNVARSIVFDRDTLKTHELFLREKNGNAFVFVDDSGKLSGEMSGALKKRGEVLVTQEKLALFVDDDAIALSRSDWDLFWVARAARKPKIEKADHPRRRMVDGFMREDLFKESNWVKTSGNWRLNQHGGGMATTLAEAKNAKFQRAVNPFSVLGSENGVLTCKQTWVNALVEARFYFGRPKMSKHIDLNTVPRDTDMLLMQGTVDGPRVAFGWEGSLGRFVLKMDDGGKWQPLWQSTAQHPPVTNWFRLGLAVRAGCIAEAYLDGELVASKTLKKRVIGPFHVVCGEALIEFDDLKAWTLTGPETKGHPLFVQSRQFAQKKLRERSDDKEYDQWAQSKDTFVQMKKTIDRNWFQAVILTRMPLMGDWEYESLPYHKNAGPLQPGLYEFQILRKDPLHPMNLNKLKPVKSLKFMRLEDGWMSNEFEGMNEENPQFTLRFRRREADGNRISVQIGDKYIPITDNVDGPVHFAIVRRLPTGNRARFPKPWHHVLTCKNLVNEFFEEAPVDWNWTEGAFRMDARWACQNQWNFMTCGGIGVPAIVGKRTFSGDQEHEFFLSLRSVFPWEAGDREFTYDVEKDRRNKWKILHAHKRWYNNRDLNFSFCFDGKNLLSGYTIMYGSQDNSRTVLLRKGKVVAKSYVRLPPHSDFWALHGGWWHFYVQRYGNRIRVQLDGRTIFDYYDKSPIKGGHMSIWTFRNGITVSRSISLGEDVSYKAHHMYVGSDIDGPWKPLIGNSVDVERVDEGRMTTKVTNRTGGGFFAVRQDLKTPIDLRATPILELPIKAGPKAKIQVHLKIGSKSYFIDTGAPTERMKSLLTSGYERGEQFQVLPFSEHKLRRLRIGAAPADGVIRINLLEGMMQTGHSGSTTLTEIAVGNTSNDNYLLAGNGGNDAGTFYLLGDPRFLKED